MLRVRETMTRACLGASLLILVFGAQGALAQPASPPAAAKPPEESRSVEKVVVTAQKRAQELKDVPIAVTAITDKDLKAKQIDSFSDLQFNVPSVTFSKGNFGGNNFQVRGIGVSAVAVSADSGVAVHTNDVYLVSTVGLSTAEYFDLDRIEVLRGPQSTLYGRNATGGAVNLITAKPDLDGFRASFEGEYGTYNTGKLRGMLNLPIDDTLAVRFAGIFAHHDGYVENIFTGNDVDSENEYALRASLRWEPSDKTTIDLMAEYGHSNDTHVRYPKQMCHRDPTGVLGCLPDKLAFEPLNGNATFGTTLASAQFWSNAFGPAFAGVGLFDLTAGPGAGAGAVVPQDLLKISTDIDPRHRGEGQLYVATWDQEISSWLSMTAIAGFEKGNTFSQENYNQAVGDSIGPNIAAGVANLDFWIGLAGGNPAVYHNAFFSSPAGTTALPLSGTANNGIIGGNILSYSSRVEAFDQANGSDEEKTLELRFLTDFDGPVNFLLAGYYLDYKSNGQYWVQANTLDYSSMALGALVGNFVLGVNGLMSAPPYYVNDTRLYMLKSKAVFGEAYIKVVPDVLNLTAGLRWTNDEKHTIAQQTILSTYVPIGTTNNDPFLDADPAFDADPSTACPPACDLLADQTVAFNRVTGRLVTDYHPKLAFTDDTMIYASYARGFKSGGINPPLSAALSAVPQYFAPETIDAYEIGTKNTLADGAMQLNLTAWHYKYADYQVSEIINRTSVNDNINAKLWGLEGELLWRITDRLQFNLNATNTASEIGDVSLVDQRNPGAGQANAVVVKDVASGANCVILMTPAALGLTPADAGVPGFYVPPGGSGSLASYGVPHVNFGSCTAPSAAIPPPGTITLDSDLYGYSPNSSGIPVSLQGNELPQTPKNTISAGLQYTMPIGGEFEVVARVDYYWQTSMWTRIFNDNPIDKIDSWDTMNAQIQLNAPGGRWYVRAFATNVFDEKNITGSYLTDASSGLFTNVFVSDPRVIGVAAGANF